MQTELPVRPRWLRALGLSLLALAMSCAAWASMLAAHPLVQEHDGPLNYKAIEAMRVSVVRYHELPLWNPFECGGLPLWDHPQGIAPSPLTWLTFLVGTTRTMELWYILHCAIGFVAAWLFARHEAKVSRPGAFVAASINAFGGPVQQHLGGGHAPFVGFLYFPLALLLWRRAEKDARYAIGLGALVAWMLFEGAAYPLPHFAILLAAESLTRVTPWRRVISMAKAGAIAVGTAVAASAARLLPIVDQLRQHTTRPIDVDTDALHWSTLKLMFVARSHERYTPGQQYVWGEFGAYIGIALCALALVGIFLALCRERRWMVWVFFVAFAFMLGHQGKWAPWDFFHAHVPVFKNLRVPSRFNFEVTTLMGVFAAVAIDRLHVGARDLLGNHRARAIRTGMVVVACAGVGEMIGVGIDWYAQTFTDPPETHPAPSPQISFGGAGLASFINQPQQNRGRTTCWDEWGFGAGAPLWDGDVPQARPSDAQAATVDAVARTQNTFTLDVRVTQPTTILVNSAYDANWSTNVGALREQNRQLVLDLPPGEHHAKLVYRPRSLTLGLFVSGFAWLGMIGLFVWDARRQRLRGARGQ